MYVCMYVCMYMHAHKNMMCRCVVHVAAQILRLVRLAKLARGLRVVRMARVMDSLHLLPFGLYVGQ